MYHRDVTSRTIEKITVVVVVAVLGASLAVNVRGAPVVLLIAGLIVTVCAGMDLVLRGEARYHPTPDLFIVPAALVTGAVLFISLLSTGVAIVAGLAMFGILLFAVFWAECMRLAGGINTDSATEESKELSTVPASPGFLARLSDRRRAELMLTLAGYVAAFALYAAIYQSKTRSLLSAPAIITITFLLAVRLLHLAHRPSAVGEALESVRSVQNAAWPRSLIYAAVIALAAGEVTWALNYWPLNGLLGGAYVLATFYFLVGVFSLRLQDRLTGRLVAEYGAVATASALLITVSGLMRRGF